jgi:NAD-dependent SIR2 family protein deacetylase
MSAADRVMPQNSHVLQAAEAIRSADALLITAGAGMGVDSGLPDFRGNEGFWKAYPIAAQLGLSFSDLANPLWFKNDPEMAWAFYGHRLNLYRQTVPHTGFSTLLNWALNKPAGYFVFTSNVDGQFQKAGFDPNLVEECHGSIHHFQCAESCTHSIWDAANEHVDVNEGTFRARKPLPRCRHCGGMARPNIAMFGDMFWLAERNAGQSQRLQLWLQALMVKSARLAVIELGAGTAIPTVRRASERIAQFMSGSLIRINPREADVPSAPGRYGIACGALEGIEQLTKALA